MLIHCYCVLDVEVLEVRKVNHVSTFKELMLKRRETDA